MTFSVLSICRIVHPVVGGGSGDHDHDDAAAARSRHPDPPRPVQSQRRRLRAPQRAPTDLRQRLAWIAPHPRRVGRGRVFDSPLSASAYDVLGVDPLPTKTRCARRTACACGRRTPTPAATRRCSSRCSGHGSSSARPTRARRTTAATASAERAGPGVVRLARPCPPADTRPRARSFGQPGGWRRERYLTLIREWAGRGVTRRGARTTRRSCGPRPTNCGGCSPTRSPRRRPPASSPTSAWATPCGTTSPPRCAAEPATTSSTTSCSARRGLYAHPVGGLRRTGRRAPRRARPATACRAAPVADLLARMRIIARAAGVRFGGAIVVLPDDDLMQAGDRSRQGARHRPSSWSRAARCRTVLRQGVPGARSVGGNEIFDIRTRLQQAVRFV